MSKLLPCPFCGGKPHGAEPEVNINYVGCTECMACAPNDAVWNTRLSPARCDELETVRKGFRWGGDTRWKPFGPIFDTEPRETRDLVTRQNAEEVIAAKDARIAELENEIVKNGEDEDLEQWFFWRRKAKKAAQRCSNQKAQIAGLAKKITKLEADNKRLREALEPFGLISSEGVVSAKSGHVTVVTYAGYFHEARAALAEVKP